MFENNDFLNQVAFITLVLFSQVKKDAYINWRYV